MAYLWLLRNSKEAVTLWAWGAQRPGASSTGNPLSLGFQSERAASRLAHGFPLGAQEKFAPRRRCALQNPARPGKLYLSWKQNAGTSLRIPKKSRYRKHSGGSRNVALRGADFKELCI